MTSDDLVIIIDENRIAETEPLNAFRDFPDLRVCEWVRAFAL